MVAPHSAAHQGTPSLRGACTHLCARRARLLQFRLQGVSGDFCWFRFTMAVGGLKLDGRLLALVSTVWTVGLIVTVYGVSKSGPGGEDKLLDFQYLGFLFRQINPYMFTAMGIASAIGFSVLGAAW